MKKSIRIILFVMAGLFVNVVALVLIGFIILQGCFNNIFRRSVYDENSVSMKYEDVEWKYKRELISFESGENTLQGYYYGLEESKGLVVISHGLSCGAAIYFTETVYFLEHGYEVFAYDSTGCHNSEGDNCVGLVQSALDLDAALTYIESDDRFDDLPVFLYGHSWGGYAVTAVHNFDHDVQAAVSVAGYSEPMEKIDEWGETIIWKLYALEKPLVIMQQKQIFGDKYNMTAVDGINNTDIPILIIHGTKDEIIPFDGSSIIAHKDEITNPNVEYRVYDKDGKNNHGDMYLNYDAVPAYEERYKYYVELYNANNGVLSEETWYQYNTEMLELKVALLDEEFMQDVLKFYENSIR